MGRFEWTRYEGGDIEHALSVMLSRRFPNSRRIRPSRGDGGRDKVVPIGDEFDVYQFKKFAQNLTGKQKAQCEHSYKTILGLHNSGAIKVREWLLTMPLDQTPENESWFSEFTADAPFACNWRGLDFCEGLAAEFQDVIDYYFHDGKQRLEDAVNNLYGLLGVQRAPDGERDPWLRPADVSTDLSKVYKALNQYDPHYRYAFIVDETDAVPERDEMVFATQHRASENDPYVTHMVFPRYEDALHDRPIPLHLLVNVAGNEALQAAIEEFNHYGTPVEFPMGTVSFDADLPGGLGGSFEGGGARLGPAQLSDGQPPVLKLQIVDENELELANVKIINKSRTRGATRPGVRLVGNEEFATFATEMLMNFEDATFSLQLRPEPLDGKHPSDLIGGLQFLSEFRAPNFLRILPEHGPAISGLIPIEQNGFNVRLTLNFAKALSELQEHTFVRLEMPNDQTDIEYMHYVIRCAALLRGEVVTEHWSSGQMVVTSDVLNMTKSFEFGFAVAMTEGFGLKIGDQEVKLGFQQVNLASVVIDQDAAVAPEGDGYLVRTKPGISNVVTFRSIDGPDDSRSE